MCLGPITVPPFRILFAGTHYCEMYLVGRKGEHSLLVYYVGPSEMISKEGLQALRV